MLPILKLGSLAYFLLLAVASPLIAEDQPPAPGLYAWYKEDGIQADQALVTAWNCSSNQQTLALSRTVRKPQVILTTTPTGPKSIVRFQRSAIWQTVESWGTLSDARTVIIYGKIPEQSAGVLFDGSTRKGMTPCRWQSGQWDVAARTASQPQPNLWQPHAFIFDKDSTPLGGFILGANVATQERLNCDIAELLVYSRALAPEEIKQIQQYLLAKWGQPEELPVSEQPKWKAKSHDPSIHQQILRQAGDDGVHTYRIPGLASTRSGTLIAVFDARNQSSADLPGDIDVAMMRSTDQGETWSPMKRIIDFDASVSGAQGNGVGDPAILVDQKTGTIFVAALWSKGGRAWHGSGPGLTPDETGQLVLVNSKDDGITWSEPIRITDQIKQPAWRLCFNGPGNGIQLIDGTLVFPAQYRDEKAMPHSCFIASRDGGETWQISPAAIPTEIPTSESAIIQLDDGALLLSMRNESRAGVRAWARWEWSQDVMQGKWSKPWYIVTDPTCMASLLKGPEGDIFFCNPNHPQKRIGLTIRSSSDGGKTWNDGKIITPGGAMYSCMTLLRDGRIGILYESDEAEGLVFAKVEWQHVGEP